MVLWFHKVKQIIRFYGELNFKTQQSEKQIVIIKNNRYCNSITN